MLDHLKPNNRAWAEGKSAGQKINDGHYNHRSKHREHRPIKHGWTTAKRSKCSRAQSYRTSRSATPRQSLYRSFEAARNENSCRTLASMDTQDSPRPRSPVLKRSVIVDGRKTSVSLENEFWTALKEIAASRGMTISALIGTIKHQGDSANLSSALRLVILAWFRNRAEAAASDSSRKVLMADEDGSDDRGSAFRQ